MLRAGMVLVLACGAEGGMLDSFEWVDEGKPELEGWPIPPLKEGELVPVMAQHYEDRAAKRVLKCECVDFELSSVRKHGEGDSRAGMWRIDLPIQGCQDTTPLEVSPYHSKWHALQDSVRVTTELENCLARVSPRPDDSNFVARADYAAVVAEIELLKADLNHVKNDLERCKTDNDVLAQLHDNEALRAHIIDYLRNAVAEDDTLLPQYR